MTIGLFDLDPCDFDLIEETRYPDYYDDAMYEEALEAAEDYDPEEDDGGCDDRSWYL